MSRSRETAHVTGGFFVVVLLRRTLRHSPRSKSTRHWLKASLPDARGRAPGHPVLAFVMGPVTRSSLGRARVRRQGLARGVSFRSLSDPIDTASAGGRLVMHIMGALAEFERGLIVERTQAGIQAAKKRGVHLGRRPSLVPAQVDHARALIERGESPRSVARTMRVGKSTLYRHLREDDAPPARKRVS